MGLDPVTGPILALTLAGLGTAGAMSMADAGAQAEKDKKARESAERAASQTLGNLTPEEAKTSASKKMFREGLYFTSPTGVQSGGTRGRSRLFGA